jgi:hypothetical protein
MKAVGGHNLQREVIYPKSFGYHPKFGIKIELGSSANKIVAIWAKEKYMPTQPVQEVISRNPSSHEVSKVLGRFADLIDETVNFGSHVLKWHLESARGGDDTAPITLSFRHILELLDAVSINIRNSSLDPCKLLLRGALESYFGVAYILETDTKRRAMAFMATYVNQRLKTYRKLDPTTQQGKEFRSLLKKDPLATTMVISIPTTAIQAAIANLENLEKKPAYKDAYKEYDRVRKAGSKNPYWYSLYGGPSNIEKLADHLNLQAFYHILYRKWSSSTHGTDIIEGNISRSSTGQVEILQLRLPKEPEVLTVLAVSIALKLFRLFIEHYAPEKSSEYTSWYQKEIQAIYLRLTKNKIIQIEI